MSASYLGIDVGTSGIRACLIDAEGVILAGAHTGLPAPLRRNAAVTQEPDLWWQALEQVLGELKDKQSLAAVAALAVNGTSATLLACDAQGRPLGPALMYNDHRAQSEAMRIAAIAPRHSAAHGAHSSLAKALWCLAHLPAADVRHLLHQADWLAGRLTGQFGYSDENNASKLGYDPIERTWPGWVADLGVSSAILPHVKAPGTPLGPLLPDLALRWDMADARVVAGTTDSTAAFLATGAHRVGQAVTSLGSTLVLKVLANDPVFAPQYGVYSHRLGDRWLVGGASNSGGAVLRQFFSDAELRSLQARLKPDLPTGLDYYPLPAVGERFPVNDPQFLPRMAPRPADDARFLQGLLEGIADIEQRGYALLRELGAPYPVEVISSGGGAANARWRELRARRLCVPVTVAAHREAAYGAALLARRAAAVTPSA